MGRGGGGGGVSKDPKIGPYWRRFVTGRGASRFQKHSFQKLVGFPALWLSQLISSRHCYSFMPVTMVPTKMIMNSPLKL